MPFLCAAVPVSNEIWQRMLARLRFFGKQEQALESRDQFGYTPLCVALQAGQVKTSLLLLELGASCMVRTADGSTPLMCLARNPRPNDALASQLLRRTNGTAAAVNHAGENALKILIDRRLNTGEASPDAVRITTKLANKCAMPLLSVEQQAALLFDAALKGNSYDVTQMMKVVDARVWNVQDKDGQTPFHYIAARMAPDILVECVRHGANSRLQNEHGKTAIQEWLYREKVSPRKFGIESSVHALRMFSKLSVFLHPSWFHFEYEKQAILAGAMDRRAEATSLVESHLIPAVARIVMDFAFEPPKLSTSKPQDKIGAALLNLLGLEPGKYRQLRKKRQKLSY